MELIVFACQKCRSILSPGKCSLQSVSKTLKIMKLVFVLLFAGFLQLSARGVSQTVSLEGKGMTLKKVMSKIQSETGYDFFYLNNWLKDARAVSVSLVNVPLEKALRICFADQPFDYQIYDKVIIIKPKAKKETTAENIMEIPAFIPITGTVRNEKGEPMAGATVTVKGTNKSVITDQSGAYAIDVPRGSTLVVSSVGYKSTELFVGESGTVLNAVLSLLDTSLDEVVVIGFGTVKRRDLTGSVSSVKSDIVTKAPVPNAMAAIQGRVAGMDFSKNVDGEDVIRIRGNRSINGDNAPLFIIDGLQGGSYSDISPNDIESIEILKDASSTAIYGYQGANGVIIITTKKGRAGQTRIAYNSFVGLDMIPSLPDYRKGESYLAPRREAFRTLSQWASPADDPNLFPNTKEWDAYQAGIWTDYDALLKQNALNQSHQITASGGNDKTSARLSLTYYDRQEQYKLGKTQRYTLRANIDHKIRSWISTGINIQATHNVRKYSPYSGGGVRLGSPYDDAGNLVNYPLGEQGYINPLIDNATGDNNVRNVQGTSLLSNGYLEIKPLQGLSFRSQLGAALSFSRDGSFHAALSTRQLVDNYATASMTTSNDRFLNWDNILTWEKQIGEHNLTLTGLTSWTQRKEEELSATSSNQLASNQIFYNLAADKSTFELASPYAQSQTFSYAFRVNYSYMGKYLLTLSDRFDGASRLAVGNKWASFPSAAVAWRVVDESFMNATRSWLDDLKLRVSYGVTGNSTIKEYGTQSGVEPHTDLGFQDKGVTYYKFKPTLGNLDLGWEKSAMLDIGLDFTLLNGRINTVIDIYNTDTKDLLLARNLPTSLGSEGFEMYQNIGSSNNKGIEIAVNTINIRNGNFSWGSTVTFSKNKEKIVDLIDGKDIIAKEKERESLLIGHPIHPYYTFVREGIWQESEADKAAALFQDASKTVPFEPGDIKVRDLDGDNVITEDKDVTYIGSDVPDWYAGFNNSFSYKNFALSIFMYFRYGQLTESPAANYSPDTGGSFANFNYWTPENPSNDLPRPVKGGRLFDYRGYQSLWFTDGSFFKLKNITLAYNLPKRVLSNARINNLRLYVTAANLLSVNKSHFLKYRDAENQARQYVLGLNLEF